MAEDYDDTDEYFDYDDTEYCEDCGEPLLEGSTDVVCGRCRRERLGQMKIGEAE